MDTTTTRLVWIVGLIADGNKVYLALRPEQKIIFLVEELILKTDLHKH
jgi:hypothetical protein